MTNSNDNVLDKVVLINLDIHAWTGRRKLEKNDIKGEVPPETLASLGSKRIIDPKKVAPFDSAKRRAERLCQSKGIRIMGAYAIPVDKITELEDELDVIQNDFYDKKDKFLRSYKNDVLEWVEQQGEWKSIILNHITPAERINQQLQFDWQIFHVRPVPGDSREGGMSDKVETMGDQLVREISEEANRIWEESFLMKTKVFAKSLEPIKSLHKKLDSLSFLDAKANAISGLMAKAIQSVSHLKTIEGERLTVLFGLLLVLSDPNKLRSFGQSIIDGKEIGLRHLLEVNSKESADNSFNLTTQTEEDFKKSASDTPSSDNHHEETNEAILGWF